MSLATFKKKTTHTHLGTKRSGRAPGGYFLPRGPFGSKANSNTAALESVRYMIDNKLVAPVGFSINGPFRNKGGVGQNMKFSQQGTPFRGIYPKGHGGHKGTYYQRDNVFNVCVGSLKTQVIIQAGNQVLNQTYGGVKPSVLSTRGMLHTRFKWAYNGQYPNYVVQPNYGSSNLSDNTSQGLYLHTKSAGADCVVDTNDYERWKGYRKQCGPFNCSATPSIGYTFNLQTSAAPYTKGLRIPQTASQRTTRIQRRCADPLPRQRPFPRATNGSACGSVSLV
jgi:hypothetical protein